MYLLQAAELVIFFTYIKGRGGQLKHNSLLRITKKNWTDIQKLDLVQLCETQKTSLNNRLFKKIPVREIDESESGQMVLEKVKWTYFDAYL